MNIGIDIDGVLQNVGDFIFDYGSKYCFDKNINFNITGSEYNEKDIFGISSKEAEKFWKTYLVQYVTSYKPRDFAVEVIKKLKENNNNIYIITARNEYGLPDDEEGNMQKLTKEWIEKNKIYYDELIFTSEDKRKVCKENKIDIMIEDSPTNVRELSEIIRVFCYDKPYNRGIEGNNITRVYSWYDILNKIVNINKV